MRAFIQRVAKASVTVEGRVVGAIERGLAILVGVATMMYGLPFSPRRNPWQLSMTSSDFS